MSTPSTPFSIALEQSGAFGTLDCGRRWRFTGHAYAGRVAMPSGRLDIQLIESLYMPGRVPGPDTPGEPPVGNLEARMNR